jgi:hypothetical protein
MNAPSPMNATTAWLADRVASLLPKTEASACVPFSSCNWGACSWWTLYACCSYNGRVWCTNQGVCC